MEKIRRAKIFLRSMLNVKTLPLMILGMFVMMNLVFAPGVEDLSDIFLALACDIYKLLIPIGFLLVVAAAVIYAGGQVGSAEMRGKSQGWAVWALVGAIMAFVIAMLGPALISAMYSTGPVDFSSCPDACSLTAGTVDCTGLYTP